MHRFSATRLRLARASAAAAGRKIITDPSLLLTGTTALSTGFRLVSNLVLAHLLVPHAFGLVAISLLVITGLGMLTDSAAWIALLRKGSHVEDEWLAQLWTLHAVRGVGLWLTACALSPLIALAYSEPELTPVLSVTGLFTAIYGLQSLRPMVRTRNLRPGMILMLQLMSQVLGSVTTIVIALLMPNVWALVWGVIAGAAIQTTLSFALCKEWPPRPHLTRPFMVSQWRIARWIGMSSGMTFFGSQIDRLVFPVMFGTAAFGVYGIAVTMALVPLQLGQRWSDNVYMPAITGFHERAGPSGSEDARALGRHAATYIALCCAALGGVGSPFFIALYPRDFSAAATYIWLLAPATYATLLIYLHRRTFLCLGITRLEVAIEASRLVLFLSAVGLGIAIYGRMPAAAYVALYAGVQFLLYVGLMAFGRARGMLHIRDDLPAHATFCFSALFLLLLERVVRAEIGAWVALLACAAAALVLCIAAALRLGLPKLPHPPSPAHAT